MAKCSRKELEGHPSRMERVRMDERSKEIAAIAASVAGHCQPCLRHHLEKARTLRVPEEDIQEAINLAKIISGKGDERMLEFAESLQQETERTQVESGGQGKKKGRARR